MTNTQLADPKRQALFLKIGACLGIPLGCFVAFIGISTLLSDSSIPTVVSTAMFLGGIVSLLLHIFTMQGSRAAWSFALSFNGACAVMFFFGAPTLDDAIQLGFAIAVIPAVLFTAATIYLANGAPSSN